MCEPLTIGAIAVGLAGSAMAAKSQRDTGQLLKAQANLNAGLADQAAADAIVRGDTAANTQRLRGREIGGAQAAAAGASGVDTSSQTVVRNAAATAGLTELDAQQLKTNAAREAWGFTAQALNFRTQGIIDEQRGNAAATGTILGGVGGALGGASSLAARNAGTGTTLGEVWDPNYRGEAGPRPDMRTKYYGPGY